VDPVVDCELCWASISTLSQDHLALLSPLEHERRERYVRACDRARFALAAALLRLLVAARTGEAPTEVAIERTCPRCGEPHGRPLVGGAGAKLALHASVSHAGELAIVALSRGAPVGVDIEALGSTPPSALVDDILAPAEAPLAADDAHAFYRIWTRKEAVLKATGAGLELGMARVELSPPDEPPALVAYDGAPSPASVISDLQPAPGHVGALCVLHPGPLRVRLRDPQQLLDAVLCNPVQPLAPATVSRDDQLKLDLRPCLQRS
jgi:4'-phosphopantetheinyl transferase